MRLRVVCLLLLLLSAAVISRDVDLDRRYQKFLRQHVNEKMRSSQCSEVMRARNIARISNSECKTINTFVRANASAVTSVCVRGGQPDGDMTKSLRRFSIVVCKLVKQKRNRPAECRYRGKQLTKRIIIKCVRHLPVHYGGDIGHCD